MAPQGGELGPSWSPVLSPPAPVLPGCRAGSHLWPCSLHVRPACLSLSAASSLSPASCCPGWALVPLRWPAPRKEEGRSIWGQGGQGLVSCLVLVAEGKGEILWDGCFHTQLPGGSAGKEPHLQGGKLA